MKPTVSVIIPFYNRIDWLKEAVDSVLSQTYNAHEIIIINDGTKEDMTSFCSIYGGKVRIVSKKNEGPASARNMGIELSTGDYIAFLDSDDIWLPQKLEIQIYEMVSSGAVWSHTSYETFIDGQAYDRSQTIVKNIEVFDGDIYPEILSSCSIATPCVVIKGEILRNNNRFRFNSSMRYGEDLYLWLNLAIQHPILAISEVLTRVRIRGTNAALRARIQLRTRSIIWKYIKQNKDLFSKKKNIPIYVSYAFNLSVLGTEVLSACEKVIKSQSCLEYISRGIYIIPWLIFKANRKR